MQVLIIDNDIAYICKMLCEKHGGFLRVYNSPGGGACVEFNIAA